MDNSLDLLRQFFEANEKGDTASAESLRTQISELEPDTESNVAAIYRLGLYRIELDKNFDKALELFKLAASSTVKCDDRYAAQVSYAIVLGGQGKKSTGIFQLRKVLSEVAPDSPHAGMALDYLALFLREEKASAEDILKVDNQRVDTLTKIVTQTQSDAEEQAQNELRLAIALYERNQSDDKKRAMDMLSKSPLGVAKELKKAWK